MFCIQNQLDQINFDTRFLLSRSEMTSTNVLSLRIHIVVVIDNECHIFDTIKFPKDKKREICQPVLSFFNKKIAKIFKKMESGKKVTVTFDVFFKQKYHFFWLRGKSLNTKEFDCMSLTLSKSYLADSLTYQLSFGIPKSGILPLFDSDGEFVIPLKPCVLQQK